MIIGKVFRNKRTSEQIPTTQIIAHLKVVIKNLLQLGKRDELQKVLKLLSNIKIPKNPQKKYQNLFQNQTLVEKVTYQDQEKESTLVKYLLKP